MTSERNTSKATPPTSEDGPAQPSATELQVAATLVTPSTVAAAPGASDVTRFVRIRLHASGGMGHVWLARDKRLERDVALKELRGEIDNAEVRRRFLVEARVTGRLEHPGIVPIYELVQDGTEVAYAMRFLQGRTLSAALKDYHQNSKSAHSGLQRASLLQAFVSICNTVAFAHARGILHRDLKGQNVLLGDYGEVIVLDWGLAKEVGQREEEASAPAPANLEHGSHTLPGQLLGTPHYMSPEQAAGAVGLIDHRSDVYSLGAILYEVLTGQAPFADQTHRDGDKSMYGLLRRIREEPPTRPRDLAAGVPAPLEAICLRALAKDPAQRYQSASELGKEVQRWLADEPVEAHPDAWSVRLGRWARRHRTTVTALAVLTGAVLVGLTVFSLLLNQERLRTDQARDRAERNFRKAQEAVDRYFTQVSEDRLLNEPGMVPLRKELLGSARTFYEDFAREHQDDPGSRQALAEALLKLAAITRAMGERPAALKILEDAQALFRDLTRTHPDVDAYELGLAQCYLNHGYQSYLQSGRSPQAEADLQAARAILVTLVGRNPARLFRSELAHAHNTIAAYHDDIYKVQNPAEAAQRSRRSEQGYLAATALWQQLAVEEPNDTARLKDLAGGYNNLGLVYFNLDEQAKARAYLRKALDLRRQVAERLPLSPGYQEDLAASYNNLGLYHRGLNEADQAENAFRQAAAVREKLIRENCQVVQFQQGLAKVYFNLGNLAYERVANAVGDVRTALLTKGKDDYQRAVELYKRLHDEQPREHRRHVDYAMTLSSMGDLLTQEKQALAIPWYDQAITHLEEILRQGEKAGVVRRSLRNAYWGRAEARTVTGQLAQAITDWDRALALDDGTHAKDWQSRRQKLVNSLSGKN